MIDRRRDVTLFLGAEGCAEQQDATWLREATVEEITALRAEREAYVGVTMILTRRADDRPIGEELERDWQALFEDGIGRPYWLMTVTGDAPLDIWNHASSHLRLRRLEP